MHAHPCGPQCELVKLTIKRHPYGFSNYYPNNPKTLGEQIRKRRLDLELTAKQVAEQLGVHYQTIINWEKRDIIPKDKHINRGQEGDIGKQ